MKQFPVFPPEHTAAWHTKTVAGVISELHSSDTGLDKDEAERRLQTYGPNRYLIACPAKCNPIAPAH